VSSEPGYRSYTIDGVTYELPEAPDVDWSKAPCTGLTHLFFPPEPHEDDPAVLKWAARVHKAECEQQAVEICMGCHLVEECQATLYSLPPDRRDYGVWAGTTPNERKFDSSQPGDFDSYDAELWNPPSNEPKPGQSTGT
jgi:hypothetical protein